MKRVTVISAFLFSLTGLFAQDDGTSTMSVLVNGTEYKTEPRRIRIGAYGYITGNTVGPDKSLRIWMAGIHGQEIKEPGTYLIIDAYENVPDKQIEEWILSGKYKGIATVKYVEETKSPRMEYHVGMSENKGETMTVSLADDGYTEFAFSCDLMGTWWKEKTLTTAFGGVDRLVNKMEDKAVTGATGFEQDIDPEGNGYKKQKTTDRIVLTEGKVRMKLD
jgi:hypothetical protein